MVAVSKPSCTNAPPQASDFAILHTCTPPPQNHKAALAKSCRHKLRAFQPTSLASHPQSKKMFLFPLGSSSEPCSIFLLHPSSESLWILVHPFDPSSDLDIFFVLSQWKLIPKAHFISSCSSSERTRLTLRNDNLPDSSSEST